MDRTERILDLLALLLDAQRPVSWAELKETFPRDYGSGSEDAALRKFERDKAELLELGIPLDYRNANAGVPGGYVVDREGYYLPPLTFSPEELAVLYTAGAAALESGAFPGRNELAHALRKVAFLNPDAPEPVPVRLDVNRIEGAGALDAHLEALWTALNARKRVKLRYRSPTQPEPTEREVEPYGLVLHGGTWTLVANCRMRGGVRSFLVHRILSLEVNASRPRSPDYAIPEGFDVDAHVARHAWQVPHHAPLEVTLELEPELVPLAARHWPDATGVEPVTGGGGRVRLEVRWLDGLLRSILPLMPRARLVAPASAVEHQRKTLEGIRDAHTKGTQAP
jgi:proteasome accessory factor B